ncbi:LysM peptidoglycan-binding domain-containing protein [Mameliella sp.]|uniref:LysM peptidoglycan-binding domain-containing protein n=2 Tax=Mameliella sp. TaxID=1924940 RepID=UPI003BAC57A7
MLHKMRCAFAVGLCLLAAPTLARSVEVTQAPTPQPQTANPALAITAALRASQGAAGKAPGVGAGPDALRTRPLARAEVHTVRQGDSLTAISYRSYGDTMQYMVIYDANRDKISAPDRIRVGQELTIPVL